MNLAQLYARTPVEEHRNILVAGGRVYVRTAEGTEEYALLTGGELELVRSDHPSVEGLAAIRQDISRIRAKLGA